jgi:beta-lactamase regulating signal transducer with metallopeptidase domain
MSVFGGLDPALVQALGWTLLHFLWQGLLAAALLAGLDVVLARGAARLRYLACTASMLLMLALPAATFSVMRSAGTEQISAPAAEGTPTASAPMAAPRENVSLDRGNAALRDRLAPALPALVALWCLGVALLSLRTLGGWLLAQRVRRSGVANGLAALEATLDGLRERLRVSQPVRLCRSWLVEVPTVVGWLRPVILLPAGALTNLSPLQLEVILAHELAHIRRCDYLVNLLQTAVETLLFYHPAVWWVSHRMRAERELCCDDVAVAACGSPVTYARALAELEGLRGAPSLAMGAGGGSLLQRIARLVGAPAPADSGPRWLAALLVLSAVAALAVGSSLQAQTAGDRQRSRKPEEAPLAQAAPAPEAAPAPDVVPPSTAPAKAQRGAAPAENGLPLQKILELAGAGVTPEYIDAMAGAGYASLSLDQLLELRGSGVGPEYARELTAAGYKGLSVDQIVNLRSQGVSIAFIKGLKAEGIDELSLSDLVELRSQGVSPEYVHSFKAAGYRELSVNQLINLRGQGVSGEFVSQFKALGYDKLSLLRLIELRSMGVNPEYVSELKALGYKELSVPVLIALRSQGVTPEYVRQLRGVGYDKLAAGELIELRNHGVTAEFVKDMKEAGYSGLTSQELIELRSHGVGAELLKRLKGRR